VSRLGPAEGRLSFGLAVRGSASRFELFFRHSAEWDANVIQIHCVHALNEKREWKLAAIDFVAEGRVRDRFTVRGQSTGKRFVVEATTVHHVAQDACRLLLPKRRGRYGLLNAKGLSLAEFNGLMQGIDQKTRAANCRHYVILDNHVGDLTTFNRLRFGVENFFYKYEKRKDAAAQQPSVN
jgi:hypothetical protein